jgi:hypothetical protein
MSRSPGPPTPSATVYPAGIERRRIDPSLLLGLPDQVEEPYHIRYCLSAAARCDPVRQEVLLPVASIGPGHARIRLGRAWREANQYQRLLPERVLAEVGFVMIAR